MNDRLLNNPVPPREIDPEISPELQEIIYRALERDPKNRYATAGVRLGPDAPGPGGRSRAPRAAGLEARRQPWLRRVLFYAMLALIPVVIFGLLLYVARHT